MCRRGESFSRKNWRNNLKLREYLADATLAMVAEHMRKRFQLPILPRPDRHLSHVAL
jgi:hypothetical protein